VHGVTVCIVSASAVRNFRKAAQYTPETVKPLTVEKDLISSCLKKAQKLFTLNLTFWISIYELSFLKPDFSNYLISQLFCRNTWLMEAF